MRRSSTSTLFIAGAGLRGEGYPNAWNTVRILKEIEGLQVVDCSTWLPDNIKLWRLAANPSARSLWTIAHILVSNLSSVARLLFRSPRASLTYIPYPGFIALWLLSWLPKAARPRCICDAFITIWDSIYQDRGLGNSQSIASRFLKSIEARALSTAEIVISDTEANANHISQVFGIPRERIRSFPLALQVATTTPETANPMAPNTRTRVLFIGTFVPLQGTLTIARAIHLLRHEPDIEFTLIGDGQQADEAAPWIESNSSATWLRSWQTHDELANQLHHADICLGIFGGAGKAARVLPFKIYLALAAGRAVISQNMGSAPENTPPPPLYRTSEDAESLADAILHLATNPELRTELGRNASSYYKHHLSSKTLQRAWQNLLGELTDSPKS